MNGKLSDVVRDLYRSAIGRDRRELPTPALILDLDAATRNIAKMADRFRGLPSALRPHTKVQKCAELARMQIEAGAIGICTATVWEAIEMSRAGIEDVLIANEVVGPAKIRALARAAAASRLTVAVDDVRNVRELSQAVSAARSTLEVLIEVDVGMGRGGVRSVDEAVAVAREVETLPGLSLRGVQGYEGHCMHEPDRDRRAAMAAEAMGRLREVVERLRAEGFACPVVSAGGTGTFDITGASSFVTEIQAGSYVFMDKFHGALMPGFENSLTVLATVAMEHGRTIVLDCGRKSIGIDFVQPTMMDYPYYEARYFAEEHALFDVDDRCRLRLGDTQALIPGYAPSTVNLHDVYFVARGDKIVDVWPVAPRGPGHAGMAVES